MDLPVIVQQVRMDIDSWIGGFKEIATNAREFNTKVGGPFTLGVEKMRVVIKGLEDEWKNYQKNVASTSAATKAELNSLIDRHNKLKEAMSGITAATKAYHQELSRTMATKIGGLPIGATSDLRQRFLQDLRDRSQGSMGNFPLGATSSVTGNYLKNLREASDKKNAQDAFLRNLRFNTEKQEFGKKMTQTDFLTNLRANSQNKEVKEKFDKNLKEQEFLRNLRQNSGLKERALKDEFNTRARTYRDTFGDSPQEARRRALADLRRQGRLGTGHAKVQQERDLAAFTQRQQGLAASQSERTLGQRLFGRDSMFGIQGQKDALGRPLPLWAQLNRRRDEQGAFGFYGRTGLAGAGGAMAGGMGGFYAGNRFGGGGIGGRIAGLAGGVAGAGGGALGGGLGMLLGGPGGAVFGSGIGAGVGTAVGAVVGTAISALETILGGLADAAMSAGMHLKTFLGHITEAGIKVERAQAVYGGLIGGKEAGRDLFSSLQTRAQNSPYSVEQLSDVTKSLLGMGITAKEITPYLDALGDIALGDADRLKRLAITIGETVAEGRLTGQRMRQFATLGVGIEDFARTMGISPAEFKQRQHANEIPSSVALETVNRLRRPGERFHGAQASVLDTTGGQYERTAKIVDTLAGKMGVALINTRGLREGMKGINEWLITLEGPLTRIAEKFGNMTTGFLSSFSKFLPGKAEGSGVVGWLESIMPSADQGAAFGATLIEAFNDAKTKGLEFFNSASTWVQELLAYFKQLGGEVSKLWKFAGSPAGMALIGGAIGGAIGGPVGGLTGFGIGATTGLVMDEASGGTGGNNLSKLLRFIYELPDEATSLVGQAGDTLGLNYGGNVPVTPRQQRNENAFGSRMQKHYGQLTPFMEGQETILQHAARTGQEMTRGMGVKVGIGPEGWKTPIGAGGMLTGEKAPFKGGGVGGPVPGGVQVGVGPAFGKGLGAAALSQISLKPPDPSRLANEAAEWARKTLGTPGKHGQPGEGRSPLEKFRAEMGGAKEAFDRGLLGGQGAEGLGKFQALQYKGFQELKQATIGQGTPADRLVSASTLGSAEARDDLNKAMMQNVSPQEQMLQTLQAAFDLQTQEEETRKRIADAIESLPENIREKANIAIMGGNVN